MAIALEEFAARFDDRLDVGAYADVDPSENGLQVEGPDEVERVALAVDAAAATVETAVERDADAMVVHHGLSWGGIERVTGTDYDRLAPLVWGDVALYAAHLPLDGHQELGNAAGVADVLGLEGRVPFGDVGTDCHVGQRGRLPEDLSAAALGEALSALDHPRDPVVLDNGPVEEVAIITGAGADYVEAAATAGADALITGEGKQRLYHLARELGVTCVLAGHYATETFGVRRLGELCSEWGLETTFVEHPTGL
jgi:dinuclear metal center YbgI/SA1388 family protein